MCFGMFDGHGGPQAAELCADFVPRYLAGALASPGEPGGLRRGHIESALFACIAAADREYIRRALAAGCALNDASNLAYHMERKTLQSAGTTACVVTRRRRAGPAAHVMRISVPGDGRKN